MMSVQITDDKEAVWLVTFIAVVVLDVALGLLIGIVLSLYFVLRHSQKPQMSQLGQLPGTGAYKDFKVTKLVKDVPGMRIFRFETSVYFANSEHFRDRLYKKTGLVPRKLLKRKRRAMHETLLRRKEELEQLEIEKKRKAAQNPMRSYVVEGSSPKPKEDSYEKEVKAAAENRLILDRFAKAWQPPINILILDLSVVNYVDTVAVKMMSNVVTDYKEVGIKVFLAGCKPDVTKMLRNSDFYKTVNHVCLFATVHEAVVIGQEIVDEEMRKKFPPRENVRLMVEMANNDGKNKQEEDDDDQFNDDDDDDVTAKTDDATAHKMASECRSDEEDDLWYDTSPYDIELHSMCSEASGLIQSHVIDMSDMGGVNELKPIRRQGSIIKDEGFDLVSFKDRTSPDPK